MAAAGDARPTSKQITLPSITAILAACAPCERKSKWCVEIIDAVTYSIILHFEFGSFDVG